MRLTFIHRSLYYTCIEADSKGAAKIPVYQKGKEELVSNRPDR